MHGSHHEEGTPEAVVYRICPVVTASTCQLIGHQEHRCPRAGVQKHRSAAGCEHHERAQEPYCCERGAVCRIQSGGVIAGWVRCVGYRV